MDENSLKLVLQLLAKHTLVVFPAHWTFRARIYRRLFQHVFLHAPHAFSRRSKVLRMRCSYQRFHSPSHSSHLLMPQSSKHVSWKQSSCFHQSPSTSRWDLYLNPVTGWTPNPRFRFQLLTIPKFGTMAPIPRLTKWHVQPLREFHEVRVCGS
ncbi:hypothetical protein BDQ12DRAFT_328800 [Crucibulum laeve]|uniref:Uncharacterized protein n=1 Tax=Crucibulum laeve TaxID=68775 RepID=A0A5C3LPM3_9AGAR|nr:hypothetical protein BDQ12DRAFT_328800 [Crucibulum laeve]